MMKKIFLPLISLVLSALMLVGCAQQDPNAPEGYKTASNDKVDYTLFVPENWVVDTEENSLVTAAHVSEYEATNITMTAYDNDQYAAETNADGEEVSPVVRYWADNLDSLTKLFDNDSEGNSTFSLVSDGQTTLMGKTADGANVPAYSYVYTGKIGDMELKYMQVIACYKNTFYFFTYTAAAERYDEFADEVNDLLGYIVFD